MRKISFIFLAAFMFSASAPTQSWHKLTVPTQDQAQVFGYYSAGCIDGAVALPLEGVGYKMVRPGRKRFYGHPDTINFIKTLAKKLHEKDEPPLLISDISAPRGGHPAPKSKHLSHYNGLDIDIWFKRLATKEAGLPVEEIAPVSMVNSQRTGIDRRYWSEQEINLLRVIAFNREVERILVNPRIKEALCKTHKGHRWLRKIRPWWGHDTHFHVRLKCPRDNPFCKSQAPVAKGDGCNKQLYWWFSDDAKEAAKKSSKKKRQLPTLPSQCDNVYNQ